MIYYYDGEWHGQKTIIVPIEQPPDGYEYHSIGENKYAHGKTTVAFTNLVDGNQPFLWIKKLPYPFGARIGVRVMPDEAIRTWLTVTAVEVKQVKDLVIRELEYLPNLPELDCDTWIEIAKVEVEKT